MMEMKQQGLPSSAKAWAGVALALAACLLLALAASGFPAAGRGAERNAPLADFTAHLDQRIPTLMRLYDIPGVSAALVVAGETVWLGAYGYADLETGRRMTADTPLRVQSISKPVTAWGVMKLVEQGQIDLDRPVHQYLRDWLFPDSPFPAEEVTTRRLLSHTAALPLGDVFTIYRPGEAMPSLTEKLTREAVLIGEPGSGFSYSNTGFNLLELLIEQVTGCDFAEYMQREILLPLGMESAAFVWSETMEPAVPVGYDLGGGPVPVYVYPERASGGLFATAEDIAAFVIAGMPDFSPHRRVLSPRGIGTLYTPVSDHLGVYSLAFDGYGLGYYGERLTGGEWAVSHGGQGSGIMTHFHAVPASGDALVILTNSQRSWPFISYLLSDWAEWRGLGPLGMGRIIAGEYALWTLIGLIWFAELLQLRRLTVGVRCGQRRAAPRTRQARLLRGVQAGAALALLAGVIWCISQPYLFLSSVFPRAAVWLGATTVALAVVLLLSALFPLIGPGKHAGE